MAARAGRYPREYRERLVELARAGRSPGSLAREFEPSEQTIRNWVRQAELDEGARSDGLTTEARREMSRLKRENKRLRTERDILKNVHDAASHPAALKRDADNRLKPGAEVVRLTGAGKPDKKRDPGASRDPAVLTRPARAAITDRKFAI